MTTATGSTYERVLRDARLGLIAARKEYHQEGDLYAAVHPQTAEDLWFEGPLSEPSWSKMVERLSWTLLGGFGRGRLVGLPLLLGDATVPYGRAIVRCGHQVQVDLGGGGLPLVHETAVVRTSALAAPLSALCAERPERDEHHWRGIHTVQFSVPVERVMVLAPGVDLLGCAWESALWEQE